MNSDTLQAEFNVRLLPVNPSETGMVSAMASEIWPEAYKGIISDSQIHYMLGSMYDPAKLRKEMAEEEIHYFWISTGGSPVGYVAFGPVRSGSACALHKCYLLPKYRGNGIGSTAMALLIAILEPAGALALELRVNRSNSRAICFYRRNYFEIFAEDRLDIGEGFLMDDFLMRRLLQQSNSDRST